jgi:hypothetical protein
MGQRHVYPTAASYGWYEEGISYLTLREEYRLKVFLIGQGGVYLDQRKRR